MAIKTYYAKLNNMGDLLNEYIIPQITGRDIIHCENFQKFDVMGIGSCCGAIWGNRDNSLKLAAKDTIKKIACSFTDKPCAIWGTGFIRDYSGRRMKLLRRNVSFIAVRGALSQKMIESALGHDIQPVLCDGGILTAEIFDEPIVKKYTIGFIPHYKEHQLCKDKGIWSAFENDIPNSTVINLRDDPISVIRRISECEIIISSSLHGCVCADSFHIPNIRVVLSGIPGSGFKFDDYYSGYGLTVPAVSIDSVRNIPTAYEVADNYKLSFETIEKKKEDMASCLKEFTEKYNL